MSDGSTTHKSQPNKNLLRKEKSPYLRQHQNNPIWWNPWGRDALALAMAQNKPIFLSIGYATCHWCHVMEGDSFVKEDIAEILNRDFIAIKVDREERPDVDAIYMNAVLAMNQQGGWPLSVFLTPNGKPFFGATYIPHAGFKSLLLRIAELWGSSDRARLIENSEEVARFLEEKTQSSAHEGAVDTGALKLFLRQSARSFDAEHGGFGSAPKFPSAMHVMLLLRIFRRTKHQPALAMAMRTLDGIARGGIFDHLKGGFHRYSTDERWLVPHFEKMLYDNALLVLAYSEAYMLTKHHEYAAVVNRTLKYLLDDLRDKQTGGFYAAEDADSEKSEGKFYLWHYQELSEFLSPEELETFSRTYGVHIAGNFRSTHTEHETAAGLRAVEDANILSLPSSAPLPDFEDVVLAEACAKVLTVRETRVRPALDDQIITSWNGLMVAALATAARALGEPRYAQQAAQTADFILEHLWVRGRLLRRYAQGEGKHPGTLEDYACLIFGLVELYQTDFNPRWLETAIELQQAQDALFWDNAGGNYFSTDGTDHTLFVRTKETHDNAVPSGNSLSALNLLRLAALNSNEAFHNQAEKILVSAGAELASYAMAFPFLLLALDYATDQSREIVISGDPADTNVHATIAMLQKAFLPNKVLAAGSIRPNSPVRMLLQDKQRSPAGTVFVCERGRCQSPTIDAQKALDLAEAPSYYDVGD